MRTFKLLPVALAVMACSGTAMAAGNSVEALEKRIQELEARLDSNQVLQKENQQVLDELASEADDFEVSFTGYARFGANFQEGAEQTVGSHGALTGNATGRLGNEGNGGEWQIATSRTSASGIKWDLVWMLEDWGSVGVKKMYAGASNIFESQPDLYLWAGRDFHQRWQSGLNDYYWMTHDGQGTGFRNLTFSGIKLDMGLVTQAEDSGDNGRYALTSRLHGIEFGGVGLDLFANYGFTSDKLDDNQDISSTAYQVAGALTYAGQKLVVRYADNAKDSVFDLAQDQEALLVSLEGGHSFSKQVGFEYQTGYQTLDVANDESRDNYNIIVRPMYNWNEVHSTWLEAGYNVVDYKDIDATNTSWKLTLSQNIAIDAFSNARPMLRFYATVGDADNEYTSFDVNDSGDYILDSQGNKIPVSSEPDTLTFGAMFEAWW